jgi:uncharacterized protein YciI
MPLRDKLRVEHRTYVRQQGEMIRLAGAFKDKAGNQCGSMFIVEADSPEQVREWFGQEAFCKNGVYETIEIIEFHLAMTQLDKKAFGPISAPVK